MPRYNFSRKDDRNGLSPFMKIVSYLALVYIMIIGFNAIGNMVFGHDDVFIPHDTKCVCHSCEYINQLK